MEEKIKVIRKVSKNAKGNEYEFLSLNILVNGAYMEFKKVFLEPNEKVLLEFANIEKEQC